MDLASQNFFQAFVALIFLMTKRRNVFLLSNGSKVGKGRSIALSFIRLRTSFKTKYVWLVYVLNAFWL